MRGAPGDILLGHVLNQSDNLAQGSAVDPACCATSTRQNSRKPARCQRTTVSDLTTMSQVCQLTKSLHKATQKSRSRSRAV